MSIDIKSDNARYRLTFVVLLTLGVSAAFVALILNFVLAVLMAAVFSALLHPFQVSVRKHLRLSAPLGAGVVLTVLLVAVGVPLILATGLVAAEALEISRGVTPWVREQIAGSSSLTLTLPEWLPYREELEPYRAQILEKLSQIAGGIGRFLFESIGDATRGTIGLFLNLFVFLYAMFFFLMRGPKAVEFAFDHLPLSDPDRDRLIDRGLVVTRATLKSILIIGLLQGILVGVAFWFIGIQGAAFWGTIVLILSAIPGLGSVIVWGPAVLYLFGTGQTLEAIGLAVWGTLIVGLVDNILRPILIGGEAKVPDLLILLAILGGIGAFGVVGIIVGPIIAAMFLTVLDIYRAAFSELLSGNVEKD